MSQKTHFSDGTVAEESSDVLMNEYMEHMYGELFKKHLIQHISVAPLMSMVSRYKNAEVWETAALFRYKADDLS